MKKGKVYLVGAGPGDPGLITKKGLDCLARAEVVVYDYLLDEQLLEAASSTAERIYAGKSAAVHAMEQNEINDLLVKKAKEGKIVVRLKGGDPFVLGRGGEEAEALLNNGLEFEVVPGVTSAVAVPAYAGIPITHRTLASSFAVITGHEDPAKENSSIKWDKLATGVDTLVFLMGIRNLPEIAANLVKFGRPANTPVAVIKEGTRSTQLTISGTLEDIVAKAKESKITPPGIIIVGEVVKMREKLRWFDNRPLFGKRILVTRARQQASALSRLLAERGAEPVELPAIEVHKSTENRELEEAINNLGQFQWIIFTSVNGVEAFFEQLKKLKRDSRALSGAKVGAIGPATVSALSKEGITADYCPTVFTTDAIVSDFAKMSISRQRFLLPRADIAEKELNAGLVRVGAEVVDITAYQTTPAQESISRAKALITSGKIDLITFTSSSTVTNLLAAFQGGPVPNHGVKIACIGPKTAETAAAAGLKIDILASEYTIPGLVKAIELYFAKES